MYDKMSIILNLQMLQQHQVFIHDKSHHRGISERRNEKKD